MKQQSIEKGVTTKQAVRDRYATALPVLVEATQEQIRQDDYDGLANFHAEKPYTLKVKIFGPEYVTGTKLSETVRQSMGKRWELFIAGNQLRDAHERKKDFEINLAYKKLVAAMLPDAQPQEDKRAMVADMAQFWTEPKWTKRNAPMNLPPAMTHEMVSARLVLWWDKRQGRFLPAIFCEDYGTAMFVRSTLRDVRACPGCNQPFLTDRLDQEFHDVGCRERHRQRRFHKLHEKKRSGRRRSG